MVVEVVVVDVRYIDADADRRPVCQKKKNKNHKRHDRTLLMNVRRRLDMTRRIL